MSRITLTNVYKELTKIGRDLQRRMRMELAAQGKAGGELDRSIRSYVIPRRGKGLVVEIVAADYAKYVDQGVQGKFRNKDPRQAKSPYKFGTGTGNKGELTEAIRQWRKRKGLKQWRDLKTGRYISYESQVLLIARAIYNRGLAPTYFIERPLKGMEMEMRKRLTAAYVKDIEAHLQKIADQ